MLVDFNWTSQFVLANVNTNNKYGDNGPAENSPALIQKLSSMVNSDLRSHHHQVYAQLTNCSIIFQLQSNCIYETLLSFKWYELPPSELQIYSILLHHAQQPQIIYIGGVVPLNMETFLDVSLIL